MNVVQKLYRHGVFNELDLSLSHYLPRAYNSNSAEFAFCVALLNQQVRQGHTCIELSPNAIERVLHSYISEAHHLNHKAPTQEMDPLDQKELPNAEVLCDTVRQIIKDHEPSFQPLSLDGFSNLYLHRYWSMEQSIYTTISEKIRSRTDSKSPAEIMATLDYLTNGHSKKSLSPGTPAFNAVHRSLERPLSLVAGRPGTGKTTLTLQILGALVAEQIRMNQPIPRIALAAPTGKAASRLSQAIRTGLENTTWAKEVVRHIPTQASTIHRLLARHRSDAAKLSAATMPFEYDVIVIDEASMVDLELMHRLLSQLDKQAKLILVGDPNQLSPVHVGTVFSDLCGPTASPENSSLEASQATSSVIIAQCKTELFESYRFSAQQGVGRLAESILTGDAQGALHLLRDSKYPDVTLHGSEDIPLLLNEAVTHQQNALEANTPAKALEILEKFRVLCPFNDSTLGVHRINRQVVQRLQEKNLIQMNQEHHHRKPILFLRNNYELGLFNGDMGIIEAEHPGEPPRVFCPTQDGEERFFAIEGLPEFQTAYAMSIHKSQGSEFDDALLLLPDAMTPFLTRELLYTAVTRVRKRLFIVGSPGILTQIVEHQNRRTSGLRQKFWSD